MQSKTKIAIIGATGHVAKGLIYKYSLCPDTELYLFARSVGKVQSFLHALKPTAVCHVNILGEFNKFDYDVVINGIGMRTNVIQENMWLDLYLLTETFDNMILEYLGLHPKTIYINFSSGAVYGNAFHQPVERTTPSHFKTNELRSTDYYGISKLYSEAKHRSCAHLKIIDLRLFAYFSRFADLDSPYLITSALNSIIQKTIFETNADNIVRDYIGLEDLYSLIRQCIQRPSNAVYDVYSREPVSKLELLTQLNKRFNLQYRILENNPYESLTGAKQHYFSTNRSAQDVGYTPLNDSLDMLINETELLLDTITHD